MRSRFIAAAVMATICVAGSAWAVPYASGVSAAGNTINFTLNQAADMVSIEYNGGVGTVDLGSLAAGDHSFDATGYADWKIHVRNSEPVGWTQLNTDGTSTSFYSPLGVSIDKDPSTPRFGQVFISETYTATTAFGRDMTSGIYMLKADMSDNGWANGGIDWAAAGNSAPFKSTIGPDGHLYVADYSNDLAYEFSADMSTATPLIDATNKTTGQYVESIWVEGTQAGGDRKIYLSNSHYLDARRGLVEYDLGANAAATASDTGSQYIGPDYFGFYPRDVTRDSDGDWYMNQYRYSPNQAPAISKFTDGTPPIDTATWETDGAYTGAYGIDLNDDAGVVAYGSYYTGDVVLFDTDTGAFVDSFNAGNRIRDVAFDAAGNIVTVDNSVEWARAWSPGGNTDAVTGSDGSFTLVPEPATIALLGLGALAALRRRR